MRRSTFLKIAVLSLGLLALAWAPAARAVAASSVGGVTFGEWNLPSFGSGFATGALLDQNNNTVFKMKAKLTETPSPALALRQGNLNGELDDGAPGFPIFFVNGSWKALALTGEGSFEPSSASRSRRSAPSSRSARWPASSPTRPPSPTRWASTRASGRPSCRLEPFPDSLAGGPLEGLPLSSGFVRWFPLSGQDRLVAV